MKAMPGFALLSLCSEGQQKPSLLLHSSALNYQSFFLRGKKKPRLNSLLGKGPKETWKPPETLSGFCGKVPAFTLMMVFRSGKGKGRKKISFKDRFQIKTHDLVTKVFRMLKKTDFCGWKRAERSTEPPVPCSCLQQNTA